MKQSRQHLRGRVSSPPYISSVVRLINKKQYRARFAGRQRQFFTVPQRVDANSANDMIIDSVIAWSFYPKLLTREGKGWRNVANNQTVSLHPTSVNKQATTPLKWLSYYHIMQTRSKFYNAHETNAVEDIAVALLCGEPDFRVSNNATQRNTTQLNISISFDSKLPLLIYICVYVQLYAGVISIDNNRIRFAVRDWKLMVAIKVLATQIRQILADIVRNPRRGLTTKQRQWMEIWQHMFGQLHDGVSSNNYSNKIRR
jgi:ATP-dependent RNA helicase DHX29